MCEDDHNTTDLQQTVDNTWCHVLDQDYKLELLHQDNKHIAQGEVQNTDAEMWGPKSEHTRDIYGTIVPSCPKVHKMLQVQNILPDKARSCMQTQSTVFSSNQASIQEGVTDHPSIPTPRHLYALHPKEKPSRQMR